MFEFLLTMMAGAAMQNPDNPLNIPIPNVAEIAGCYPAGVTADTPMNTISDGQKRHFMTCLQALMAAKINSAAPLTVDQITTLTTAQSSGTTLQYNLRVDIDAAQITTEIRSAIDQEKRAEICGRGDMAQTISHGGAYRYVWNDRYGRPIHQLLIENCP